MKRNKMFACLAFAGMAVAAAAAIAAEKVIPSQWAAAPVRVDGANQEWQDAAILVDKTSKAEYALRNDDKYLYILFLFKVVKGVPVLSTYEMSGMKVFFSLDAKKHKDVGFHFVKKTVTADELIASLEKAGEVLTDEKKAGIRLQKSYMIFEGVPLDAKSPAPVVPVGPADPPTFRDSIKRDLSVVEFRIPLVYLAQAGAVAAPGSPLKLGFEWGGMNAEMRSAYMARMADSGAQAQGQRGGGFEQQLSGEADESAAGGGGGGMGGRPDPRTKKYNFWIDIQLATKGS